MKKYNYRSAIVSSVVVKDSKQTTNQNEITSIFLKDDDAIIFITGYIKKNTLYGVNIHKEFCTHDNIDNDECINYKLIKSSIK